MRDVSKEEYLEASGWSSNKFVEHAKFIFNDNTIKRTTVIELHRTVVYIKSKGTILKGYVHHSGRSKEFLTFKDEAGTEVQTFHCSTEPKVIRDFLVSYFTGI